MSAPSVVLLALTLRRGRELVRERPELAGVELVSMLSWFDGPISKVFVQHGFEALSPRLTVYALRSVLLLERRLGQSDAVGVFHLLPAEGWPPLVVSAREFADRLQER